MRNERIFLEKVRIPLQLNVDIPQELLKEFACNFLFYLLFFHVTFFDSPTLPPPHLDLVVFSEFFSHTIKKILGLLLRRFQQFEVAFFPNHPLFFVVHWCGGAVRCGVQCCAVLRGVVWWRVGVCVTPPGKPPRGAEHPAEQ